MERGLLTSDFNEKAGNAGERGVSRKLAYSTSSFSLNKRTRSEMERSLAVSRDMVAVTDESDSAPRPADRTPKSPITYRRCTGATVHP